MRIILLTLLAAALALAQSPAPGSGSVTTGARALVTITTLGALYSGTYTSGITGETGSAATTCILTFTDGSTATVPLTGTNAIAGATALTITHQGTGFSTPPTTATVSAGTATGCTGTVVLATVTAVNAVAGLNVNSTAGKLTYVLPAVGIGATYTFRNYTTRTGALTLRAPASTYIDVNGSAGSVAGTLVSGGALGDNSVLIGLDSTHYLWDRGYGTWTNN
jgi:hypothetical protein